MQMSAIMESGMVRLNARVPIREDVRKQPLRTQRLVTKITTSLKAIHYSNAAPRGLYGSVNVDLVSVL